MIDKTEPTKFILDACCGMKYMWMNKNHPNTIYMDIRKEEKGFNKNRPYDNVSPDIMGDFTNLPEEIKAKRFKLIVWDVPHFKARKLTGNLLKCYGGLNPETWQSDLKKGFTELWNVLEDYGILLFKFSDYHIKFKEVISLFPVNPLFYNITNTSGKSDTKWFCFMKIPGSEQLIAPNQNSASQVVNDEHNISLKDNSNELSQISSNDETSLNNNIHRLRPNLKKCSQRLK